MQKKAQISGQIFLYVLGAVILAVVLIFGYRQISGSQEKISQVELISLESSLKGDIGSIGAQFGEYRKKEYLLKPPLELCLADFSRKDEILRSEIVNFYPLIKDRISSGLEENAFIVNRDTKAIQRAFSVGKITLDHYPYILCTNEQGKLEVGIEGRGDGALLLSSFKTSLLLAGAGEKTLISPDGLLSLEVPEDTRAYSPSGTEISEISIELVEVPSSVLISNKKSDVYLFQPEGTTFSSQVRLVRAYDPQAVGDCPGRLTWTQHKGNGELKAVLESKEIDCETKSVTFEINGFSYGYMSGGEVPSTANSNPQLPQENSPANAAAPKKSSKLGKSLAGSAASAFLGPTDYSPETKVYLTQSKDITKPNEEFAITWNSSFDGECVLYKWIGYGPMSEWAQGISGEKMASPYIVGSHSWLLSCFSEEDYATAYIEHEVTPDKTGVYVEQSVVSTDPGDGFLITWGAEHGADSCTILKAVNDDPLSEWAPQTIGNATQLKSVRNATPVIEGLHRWLVECIKDGQKEGAELYHKVALKEPYMDIEQSSEVSAPSEPFSVVWHAEDAEKCSLDLYYYDDTDSGEDAVNVDPGSFGGETLFSLDSGAADTLFELRRDGERILYSGYGEVVEIFGIQDPSTLLVINSHLNADDEMMLFLRDSQAAYHFDGNAGRLTIAEGDPDSFDYSSENLKNYGSQSQKPVFVQSIGEGLDGKTIVEPTEIGDYQILMMCVKKEKEFYYGVYHFVEAPPIEIQFDQSRRVTKPSEPFLVEWKSENADQCTVFKSVNYGDFSEWASGTSGSKEATPVVEGYHLWEIKCTNSNDRQSAIFWHSVSKEDYPDPEITATSEVSAPHEEFKVSWNSFNAKDCVVSKSVNDGPMTEWARGLSGEKMASPYIVGYHIWSITCSSQSNIKGSWAFGHVVTQGPLGVDLVQSSYISKAGEPFTIDWTSDGAESCKVSKSVDGGPLWEWASGTSGTKTATPTQIGTHRWLLECSGKGTTEAIDLYHLVVGEDGKKGGPSVPPPIKITLDQSKAESEVSESFDIIWSAQNADSCNLTKNVDNGEFWSWTEGISGTKQATPARAGTHVWQITCKREGASEQKTISHVVKSKKPVVSASISQSKDSSITSEAFDISWSAQNVDACKVYKSVNDENKREWASGISGTKQATPVVAGTHRWWIECSVGDSVSAIAELYHSVLQSQGPSASITQSLQQTKPSDPFTVSWNSMNADVCKVYKSVNSAPPSGEWASGTSGTKQATPVVVGTHRWWIECSKNGQSATAEFSHIVASSSPLASISQSLEQSAPSEPFTVSWSSSNADSCKVYKSVNGVAPSGEWGSGTSGTKTATPVVLGAHRWWIECTGSSQTSTAEFTHTVFQPSNSGGGGP